MFKLSDNFMSQYRGKQPNWGYQDLSYFVYKRTYARSLEDGSSEEFWQTCQRVVEGVFNIQLNHCKQVGLEWNPQKAQASAQKMFTKMWEFKFLPPGRGLWLMGTPVIEKIGSAGMNNCGFISTKDIHRDFAMPFCWAADMLMLGVGCIAEDTWIQTNNGPRKIQDLTHKPLTICLDGKEYSAGQGFWSSGRKNVLRISLQNGNSLRLTPDHKVQKVVLSRTTNNEVVKNIEWVEAQHLTSGDLINLSDNCMTEWDSHGSYEEGYLAGIVMGDGWFNHHNVVATVFDKDCGSSGIAKHALKCVATVDRHPAAQGWRARPKRENSQLTIGNWIHEYLDQSPKVMKDSVEEASSEFYRGFIKGMFDTDGTVINSNKGYGIRLTQASLATMQRMQRMLLRLGIQSSITRKRKASDVVINNKPCRQNECWDLSITGKDLVTFVERVGFEHLEKKQRVFDILDSMQRPPYDKRSCARVESIQDDGVAETFDVNVPQISCFESNGIITHNCGFDTKGAKKLVVNKPDDQLDKIDIVVPDTREGWVEAIGQLLNSYAKPGQARVEFDFSLIREAGAPIKGFGGVASGAAPLRQGLESIRAILDSVDGQEISSVVITDIMNFIGKLVVSGNVRRSAEIAIGEEDDLEFMQMKDPELHPEELNDRRWASNNSLFVTPDSKFSNIVESIAKNGEPGLIFLGNARHYGRMKDGRHDLNSSKFDDIDGFNPCAEQGLKHGELCCVSKDTRILTRDGYPTIGSIVGERVEVWNGKNWSKVTPFLAGKDKTLFRVHLSDGSYLDATADHKWSVSRGRGFKQLETKEMVVGDKLESFEMDTISGGIKEENAYQYGWIAGDGFIDGVRVMALVQEPEYSILPSLGGIPYKEQHPDGYSRPFRRVNLSSMVDYDSAVNLRNDKLPDVVYSWDAQSISEFFGGWIDTDGCLRQNPDTDHYVLHGSEGKLREAQLLLRRIGINHASLRIERKAGEKTNYGVAEQDLWVLLIPSYECSKIATRLKVATRFGGRLAKNNAHKNSKYIDRARKQKVVKIEQLTGSHDTFCFSEPERHMGVFGNVLTYQCLVETFPANHDSVEEYHDTLKIAFMYAKTVTLIPTHNALTNQVMLSNRRIGLSMSGVQQALKKFGFADFFENFCDRGYEQVRHWDRIYSRWLGIPISIKVTTIKPSGTVSLLAGATPGVHCTHSPFYFRSFRLSAISPLVGKLLNAGYKVEFSVTDAKLLKKAGWDSSWGDVLTKELFDEGPSRGAVSEFGNLGGSLVVYFPVKEKNFTKSKFDISVWEQLCLARELQDKWSDNSVSITVTFKPEEAANLQCAIEYMASYIKTLSFLPLMDHKYAQAPYIEITKEQYEEYSNSLKRLRLGTTKGLTAKGEKYCTNDTCTLE